MHIILASPRGYCAGVEMAIEALDLAVQRFGTPIYVYHEIVHNQYVVERFRSQGVVFVDRMGVAGFTRAASGLAGVDSATYLLPNTVEALISASTAIALRLSACSPTAHAQVAVSLAMEFSPAKTE